MDKKNEIFIRYKFNSTVHDVVFKESLNKYYGVQSKPIFIPSATDGGEMWFQIFLSIDFKSFIAGAIASGAAWDLVKWGGKKFFLRPLFSALEKLMEENDDNANINLRRVEVEFDDVTIRILGIHSSQTSKLSQIFQAIVIAYPRIQELGLGDLSDIVLPVIESEDKYRRFVLVDEYTDLPEAEDYLKYWLIEFNHGVDMYYYDVQKNAIMELNEY